MKNLQASRSARNSRDSSFQHCGSPVKLVKACLSVRKELEGSFHHL